MKIESGASRLLALAEAAVDLAVDDTLEVARANAAKNARTGEFAGSLTRTPLRREGARVTARIGSPLASAKAKEVGAFVRAKKGPVMRFRAEPSGEWVTMEAFRVPAQPVVTPAGRQFPRILTARLGALNLGGSGSATAAGSPDFRGGAVRVRR